MCGPLPPPPPPLGGGGGTKGGGGYSSQGFEGVKKSTRVVILSGAKDLHSFVFKVMQMLRYAQHDRFRFFHTCFRSGLSYSAPTAAEHRTHGCRRGLNHVACRDGLIYAVNLALRDASLLFGFPPKGVWIRRGNCRTGALEQILRERHSDIERFHRDNRHAYLILV